MRTKKLKHTRLCLYSLLATMALAWGCVGEDRSSERPFPPTVRTHAITDLDTVGILLRGQITSSPNSRVHTRGFIVARKDLRLEIISSDTLATWTDTLKTDTLLPGTYYYSAYATNGIGTGQGDTLSFTIFPR